MQQAPSLLQILKGHKQSIVALDLHPKCRLVASAGLDSTFLIWDIRDKNQSSRKYEGHKAYIQDLKFHPNGAIIASASADGAIKFWQNQNQTKQVTITKAHNSKIRSIGYSCDGNLLVSGGDDKNVKIWSTIDRRLQAQLKKHENWVRYCQFSPIAKNIASCDDRFVYIWDIPTKKVIQQFKQHTGVINQVRFHSLSNIIASCSYDKKIKLYDLRTNQVVQIYEGHSASVKTIDFHPHTCHLISSSDDGTTKIWNTAKNRLQYTIDTPSNVTKFSREGDYFVTAGVEKVVNLWKTGFYDGFKEKIVEIGNVGGTGVGKVKWEVKEDGNKYTSQSQQHNTSKKVDKNKPHQSSDPQLIYCHQKQNFEYMNRPVQTQRTQKSLIPLSLQKKLLQMSTQIDFITKTTQILQARVLNNGEQLRRIVEMVEMGNVGGQEPIL